MGNICRSPTAEGVFRHYVENAGMGDRIVIDSAGTHAYHVGDPPDRRAKAAAERRGIMLGELRARRVSDEDFERFDHIIAMDLDNLERLKDQSPPKLHGKVKLFLEFRVQRSAKSPTLITAAPRVSSAYSTWLKRRPEHYSRRFPGKSIARICHQYDALSLSL